MSTTSIFNNSGDTKKQVFARAHYGNKMVFVKQEPQFSKTRAWFIAKKSHINEDIVSLSHVYANVEHNKCVYEDDIMTLILG